jgi:hypothetical protein
MAFEYLCTTLIALFVGAAICFGGYRWFLILLPVWGFFFGFGLGAQSIQILLGVGFLATVSGWLVGFIVGLLFAVLSYLFYTFGVLMLAGSLGYALGVGFMGLLGFDPGIITWLVGIVIAAILVVATFYFDLARYAIVGATAVGGAGLIVITFMYGPGGVALARLLENPVRAALNDSFWWTLLFLILAIGGIVVQVITTRRIPLEPYPDRV